MDTHTFQKTVASLESLPEGSRARALKVGERLTDEQRGELATKLTHLNERIREKEVEAEQSLIQAEQDLTRVEGAFRKVARSEREERGQERDVAGVEEKLNTDKSSRRS